MTDICLFPIPDCVTFPGTVLPLHVFEPRYRKMVRYCLDNDALLGVCHTRKQLSAGRQFQDMEEALQSNQATYKHHDIFSAGRCELNATTEDGRMYLKLHLQERYKAVLEKQTLPFMIYECDIYPDLTASADATAESLKLKQKLLERLQILAKDNNKMQAKFDNENWQKQSIEAFSFELFGVLTFPADIQQKILSTDSVLGRLKLAFQLISALSTVQAD